MLNWCRVPSVYVPCVPQRYVMCALATSGTVISWMMFFSGYKTFKEIISYPLEHTMVHRPFERGRCFNSRVATDVGFIRFVKVFWPRPLLNSMLHVFWFAFAVSSVVSGLVVDSVGPRHFWGLGGLLTSVACTIVPHTVTASPYATLACLVFTSIGFGAMSPCSSVLVAHWAPEIERTTFVAFIESAFSIGVFLIVVLHSHISPWDGSWEVWLYVSCALNIVWIMIWYTLFYNLPAQHPHIPPRQLQHLETTTAGIRKRQSWRIRNALTVPWKEILLSLPFWSLQLCNLASAWVQSILLYKMNEYITNVFYTRSMMIHGVYMMVLALGISFGSTIIHGWISDKLISKGVTSRTTNRRFFLVFANYTSASLLLAIPFFGCKVNLVLLAFYILVNMQSLSLAPLNANFVDLAPRYAGLLRGLMSAGRALATVFCDQLADFLLDNVSDRYCWVSFFNISAVILIVLSSPYLCFGTGEIQTWNDLPKTKITENRTVLTTAESHASEPNLE